MPFSIGFGDDTYRTSRADGLFGTLAALASDARPPGLGGIFQSIADPSRVLTQQYATEDRQRFNDVREGLAEQYMGFQEAVHAGDMKIASDILSAIQDTYLRQGYDPQKATANLLSFAETSRLSQMQLLNNQDPNYLNKLGGFARTPQEGANIVQTGVENQRIGMETQGAEARRDKTRQDIAQSGQLFPGMQEEQRLGNQRIQSDINLKGAQMQTEGALAGKANAEAANVGKSGGMDAGEYQRAVRAHYNAATDYFGRLSGSKDIFGNETPPYTPEQAKAVETILNRDAQRLGLPDQYGYEVTQGPAERDTRTGESLPGPQVITPRVSQRKNVSQMNDDEVLNAMKSYDVPQQARARRQALQEEIHKATDRIPETPEGNMRAKAIAAEIARRFLKELSGGE